MDGRRSGWLLDGTRKLAQQVGGGKQGNRADGRVDGTSVSVVSLSE